MPTVHSPFLLAGGVLSALAALLHLACIAFGAPWYRAFGAGEKMLRMVEAGSPYPTRVTLLIATMLLVWSAYAFSGAGVLPRLPLLRMALCAITFAYLARAIAFPVLMPMIPGNTLTFWLASSTICAVLGVVHFIGLRQAWPHL